MSAKKRKPKGLRPCGTRRERFNAARQRLAVLNFFSGPGGARPGRRRPQSPLEAQLQGHPESLALLGATGSRAWTSQATPLCERLERSLRAAGHAR